MDLGFKNDGFTCDTCEKDLPLLDSSQGCFWHCNKCNHDSCFDCYPISQHNVPSPDEYKIPICENNHDMEIADYGVLYTCHLCEEKNERDDHWQCPKCTEHICTMCKELPLNFVVLQFHNFELPPDYQPKSVLRTLSESTPIPPSSVTPINPSSLLLDTPDTSKPQRPKCVNEHDMYVTDELRFTCDLCDDGAEYIDHWRCWRCDFDFCAQCYPIPTSIREKDIELR